MAGTWPDPHKTSVMENIKRKFNQNLGSIEDYLRIAYVENITVPRAINEVVQQDVTFADGESWMVLELDRQSVKFTERSEDDEDGTVYTKRISGTLRMMHQDYERLLPQLRRRQLVILFYDRNEGVLPTITGNAENWMEYESSRESGSKITGYNHYEFTFRGKHREPARYYAGEVE